METNGGAERADQKARDSVMHVRAEAEGYRSRLLYRPTILLLPP